MQFDERAGAARFEARDSRFVGAGGVGYIELSAADDSIGASKTRSRLDGVDGRIECMARDADAFGIWIGGEGAAVVE
ncbi:hypothetical protein [Caballeronia cordobensis]|uniref:hypothetical protein n=1 Tax=Caballeronia cordobensis TaxID=1353886 RepID=UPI00135A4EFC|nr:hypothetical protein [Caballeronia cordobensis]